MELFIGSQQKYITCAVVSEEDLLCNGTEYHLAEHKATPEDAMFWVFLGIYAALVLGAGLMSGLTIGLLSLDLLSLKVLSDSGTGETKRYARRLFPIIRRHHWLLVTLLLGNAACVEAMPIFLDRVSDPVTAILVSVTAVLFFGEVIPQALCTRYGLKIGYYCSPIVYTCMAVMSPIAYPIAKLLDCLLGSDHETVFKREELKSLVSFHGPELDSLVFDRSRSATSRWRSASHRQLSALDESEPDGSHQSKQQPPNNSHSDATDRHRREVLTREEVTVIRGALELTSATAGDACTPIDRVFMLSDSLALDAATRRLILQNAHSRVPVYHGNSVNDIRGHLLVKMLLRYEVSSDQQPPGLAEIVARDTSCFREMPFVKSSAPLYDLLKIFQLGKSHMAVVLSTDHPSTPTVRGIITLENVLERLLLHSISDEADNLRREQQQQLTESFAKEDEDEGGFGSRRVSVSANGITLSREVNRISLPEGRRNAGGLGGDVMEVRTTRDTERTPLLMGQKIVSS